MWQSGSFSVSLRKTIFPIPNPDKDHFKPKHVRHIALINCISMQRTINNILAFSVDFVAGGVLLTTRLDWKLLFVELLVAKNVLHLSSVILENLKTTWKHGIINDLFGIEYIGPTFELFKYDRHSMVDIGCILSGFYDQGIGIPRVVYYLLPSLVLQSTVF